MRFFTDIRDPQTYEPNRTANRILQKITNRNADLPADIRGSVRFGSTRTALFPTHKCAQYSIFNFFVRIEELSQMKQKQKSQKDLTQH